MDAPPRGGKEQQGGAAHRLAQPCNVGQCVYCRGSVWSSVGPRAAVAAGALARGVRPRPVSAAGFPCADDDLRGAVPERPQVLGVLDSVAGGKLRKHCALHQLRPLRYAGGQLAVPRKRHLVAGQLAAQVRQARIDFDI